MIRERWRVIDGEVLLPLDEAEWWGASLAILVSAIHHPALLKREQPGTDPMAVARDVLEEICELREAAACAESHPPVEDIDAPWRSVSVRRRGEVVAFTPGVEVANLVLCLIVFATAVLEPEGAEATLARGALAYAASAWSRDIGTSTGAL